MLEAMLDPPPTPITAPPSILIETGPSVVGVTRKVKWSSIAPILVLVATFEMVAFVVSTLESVKLATDSLKIRLKEKGAFTKAGGLDNDAWGIGALTATLKVAVTLEPSSAVAVIVADPPETAMIRPEELTDATLGLLEI